MSKMMGTTHHEMHPVSAPPRSKNSIESCSWELLIGVSLAREGKGCWGRAGGGVGDGP